MVNDFLNFKYSQIIKSQTGITSVAKKRIIFLSTNSSWKNKIMNVTVVIKGIKKNDKLVSNLFFLKFWNKLRKIVREENEMKKQENAISSSVNKGI